MDLKNENATPCKRPLEAVMARKVQISFPMGTKGTPWNYKYLKVFIREVTAVLVLRSKKVPGWPDHLLYLRHPQVPLPDRGRGGVSAQELK